MDFAEEIASLGKKSQQFGERFKPEQINEELTKNALIMPFIRALGYDIFDPMEVVPEFSAAIGEYKDARVDYAILRDGKPIIIVECKAYGSELDAKKCNQLMLYFHGTEAKVAILTDGNRYQFYSDLEEDNKMDSRPYMEFSLEKLDTSLIPELQKLTKGKFNIEEAMSSANVLKYTREFKRIMAAQLAKPEDDFLTFFLRQCYDGKITQNVKERFTPILKDAINAFIKDRINDRLQNALDQEQIKAEQEQKAQEEAAKQAQEEASSKDAIITTDDEKEGYFIVKSMLIGAGFDGNDILLRDHKLFCNICFQRPHNVLVRMRFNNKPYKIAFIENNNGGKKEERFDINKVDDIFTYKDRIIQRARDFQSGKVADGEDSSDDE